MYSDVIESGADLRVGKFFKFILLRLLVLLRCFVDVILSIKAIGIRKLVYLDIRHINGKSNTAAIMSALSWPCGILCLSGFGTS